MEPMVPPHNFLDDRIRFGYTSTWPGRSKETLRQFVSAS